MRLDGRLNRITAGLGAQFYSAIAYSFVEFILLNTVSKILIVACEISTGINNVIVTAISRLDIPRKPVQVDADAIGEIITLSFLSEYIGKYPQFTPTALR